MANLTANDYDELSEMIFDYLRSKGYISDENTSSILIQEEISELTDGVV